MKAKNVLRAMLVMALLAMIFAIPASADKPDIYFNNYEEDNIDTSCGVEIPYHTVGKVKYTLWFDQDGNAYGDSYHVSELNIFSYEGRQVTFKSEGVVRFTWADENLVVFNGIIALATIPGHGIVRASAGRLIYRECNEEGCEPEILHPWHVDFIDQETICNYLLTGE